MSDGLDSGVDVVSAGAATTAGRLLIVSNRLPCVASLRDGRVELGDASGGLATGLRSWYGAAGGRWIGWPGAGEIPAEYRAELDDLLAQRNLMPVHLSTEDVQEYYEGFANRVLWPLCHYLIDRVPVDATGWEAYRRVNELFADAVVAAWRPGDAIWVHDYQLLLLPALLRARLPSARIGFFLHIPFPSSEVFRILPWRRELLHGMLGADLLGFHTFAYLRHFLTSLLHLDGIEADVDRLHVHGRTVQVGVFPMGVDAAGLEALASEPDVLAEACAIREDAGGRRILLGIDRLDYTKGIPRRLLAIERLLRRYPELRDEIRYIQIAVPSRGMVDSYQRFRRQVDEAVGRINGACGTLRSTPIHYMYRSVSPRQLAALYRAADVMLVTPLRDGMNLVAKEFLASRPDGDGVLVLSEFAGAAAELGDAMVVNPYDVDGTADTIHQALRLDGAERRRRMSRLRDRVRRHDVHWWASQFVERLVAPGDEPASPPRVTDVPGLHARICDAPHLALLLDYDGTLVPIAALLHLATPDPGLLALLAALARRPGTEVHLVSGRPREFLDTWFGALPIALWAEHGFWHRPAGAEWETTVTVHTGWMRKVLPILEQFAQATPGAHIERKSASLAWHYRQAEPEFGARQAHELRMLLGDTLSNQPLEVLEGRRVIEVRVRGVSKALVAQNIQHVTHAAQTGAGMVVAVGDDRTDDDLFAALGPGAVSVAVGTEPLAAACQLPDPAAVRRWLESIVTTGGEKRPA